MADQFIVLMQVLSDKILQLEKERDEARNEVYSLRIQLATEQGFTPRVPPVSDNSEGVRMCTDPRHSAPCSYDHCLACQDECQPPRGSSISTDNGFHDNPDSVEDFDQPTLPPVLDASQAIPQEDTQFPIEDWKYEVANGDTGLGYQEWVLHCHEAEDNRPQANCCGMPERIPSGDTMIDTGISVAPLDDTNGAVDENTSPYT